MRVARDKMLLVCVLVLVTALAGNTVSSQPCQRLFMQGLDNTTLLPYAELSGLYSLTNITIDGFSAYRHDAHPGEYFFYNRTVGLLTLGYGLLLAETTGRLPATNVQYPYNEVIARWFVHQPTTGYESLSAEHIRPRCVDADPEFQRCDSGQLTFTEDVTLEADGQPVNVTNYKQVYGQYTGHRPIYKAAVPSGSSVKVYLYHVNGTWRLGHDYTMPTSVFAAVSDTALRPEFITGIWQLHYNGVWHSHLNLKLQCSGIASATSCSEVQCQNGGTCVVTAGSQNVQCSCQRGYRGRYCEHRVPTCQDFGNLTGHHHGFYRYYTEDTYEGSLAAWFCAQGSRPKFAYSVCENRNYRPSWSSRATCQSLTTTTQQIWSSTTPYRYPRYPTYPSHHDDLMDVLESSEYWLTPAVAVGAILTTGFAPLIIYFILTACCGYRKKSSNPFAKADEQEEKAIGQKYQKELDKLDGRAVKTENAVIISELHRMQQQLEEELDQLRAKRRQRDRETHKTVKLFRIISQYYYVSFWLWMIYLIIGFAAQLDKSASLLLVLDVLAVFCMIVLLITIWVESWGSYEKQYIENLSLLTSATERIESIRNAQPTVTMNAKCYHFEPHTDTVFYVDGNGNLHERQETYQEKVVTATIVEPFRFTHWFDSSQSTLTDVHRFGITEIKMDQTAQFGDEKTARLFGETFQRFQDENRSRDVFVNFFVLTTVEGFEKRLTAYTGNGNKPAWISSVWFWLATVFCLGWPYRIMFNRIIGKTDYNIVKVIFSNIPSTEAITPTPPMPTDADHTTEPPSENAEENTIKNMKMKIQVMIDQLTGGLERHDGTMPIKCATTDQHINVTMHEAHHAPQTTIDM